MLGKGFLDWLREQDDRTKTGLIGQLEERERALIRHDWPLWRREAQSPPRGAWNCWVICAGRGFGKTRTGAEWVRECAILDPDARIALVAASLGEARSVMVEGESGVLAIWLRWIDGPLTGIAHSIVDAQENTVTLADPLLPEVQPGRRVLLREGCDRTLATCADRFGNALNFRGEPFLPGNDMMARYPVPR